MKEALKGFHKTALIDDYNKYINNYGEAPSDAFDASLILQSLGQKYGLSPTGQVLAPQVAPKTK